MKTYLCHLMSGFFGSILSVQDSSILLYIGSVYSLLLVYNSLLYKYTKIYSSTPNGYLGRAQFVAVMNNSYKHSSTWLLSSFLLGIYLERKAFSHSECTCFSWVFQNHKDSASFGIWVTGWAWLSFLLKLSKSLPLV